MHKGDPIRELGDHFADRLSLERLPPMPRCSTRWSRCGRHARAGAGRGGTSTGTPGLVGPGEGSVGGEVLAELHAGCQKLGTPW